jgi:hypothetical protein
MKTVTDVTFVGLSPSPRTYFLSKSLPESGGRAWEGLIYPCTKKKERAHEDFSLTYCKAASAMLTF